MFCSIHGDIFDNWSFFAESQSRSAFASFETISAKDRASLASLFLKLMSRQKAMMCLLGKFSGF